MKRKKLYDFDEHTCDIDGCCRNDCMIDITNEAIKWIKNLRRHETEYPIVLEAFPDSMKGSVPKELWYDDKFRLGAEYGMIAWIMYFFEISEEDLKNENINKEKP